MTFENWLETQVPKVTDETKQQIFLKATTEGIPVNRGIKPHRASVPYTSDPGDFGRGIYYSTNWHRARSYATSEKDVEKSVIKFKNPAVLTDHEAYKISERFHTIVLSDEEFKAIKGYQERIQKLLDNALEMINYMIGQGYDGFKDGNLEIVDYRPCASS